MRLTSWMVAQRKSLPLEQKIIMAISRIRQFDTFAQGKIFVSVSGKDSVATLHLVRSILPSTPAVFVDTGLEYPEIVKHIKSLENVIIIKPKMRFDQVIEKYGYPVVSKEQSQIIREIRTTRSPKLLDKRLHGKSGKISNKWLYLLDAPFPISEKCCSALKKTPLHDFVKRTGLLPITGIMADNSSLRLQSVMKYGCNALEMKIPQSRPIAMWSDDDVWTYLREFNVPYSEIYDMGYKNTGCMYCGFGLHREKHPNRFERMKETHPKRYDFCMEKLGLAQVLEWYPERKAA